MSHLRFKKNCVECNEEFIAKTMAKTTIYCSLKCYKRNWRRQRKDSNTPKEKLILTKEDLCNKHYLSVKEAVIVFDISETTLRRLTTKNKVKYVCFKNRFLFLKADLANHLS